MGVPPSVPGRSLFLETILSILLRRRPIVFNKGRNGQADLVPAMGGQLGLFSPQATISQFKDLQLYKTMKEVIHF